MESTFNSASITPESSYLFWFIDQGDELLGKNHFKELNYLFNYLLLKDQNIQKSKSSILTTENFNQTLFLFIHFLTGKEGLGEIFSKSKHYVGSTFDETKNIIFINECRHISINDLKRTSEAAFTQNKLYYFS